MNKINNLKKKPLMTIRDNSDDSTLDNKIEAYQKAIVFNQRLVHSDRTSGGVRSSNHLGSTANILTSSMSIYICRDTSEVVELDLLCSKSNRSGSPTYGDHMNHMECGKLILQLILLRFYPFFNN